MNPITKSTSSGMMLDFGDMFTKKSSNQSTNNTRTKNPSDMKIINEYSHTDMDLYSDDSFPEDNNDLSTNEHLETWKLPTYCSVVENEELLNRQLSMTVGFHDFLKFDTDTSNELNTRCIMDCISFLLHIRNEEVKRNEEISSNSCHLKRENDRLQNRITTLQNSLMEKEKLVSETQNRLKASEKKFATDKILWKEERRELEKKCIQLQHVDQGYKASMKKQETLYSRLQKQFHERLSKSSNPSNQRGIAIGKPLRKSNQTILHNSSSETSNSSLSNMLIQTYENKQRELIEENSLLRESYRELSNQLKQLIREHRSASRLFQARQRKNVWNPNSNMIIEDDTDDQIFMKDLTSSTFDIPLNWSNENIVTYIQTKLNETKEKIQSLKEKHQKQIDLENQLNMEEKLKYLTDNLQFSQEIIIEQDQMIRTSLQLQNSSGSPNETLDFSYYEQLEEELNEKTRQLQIQLEHFEQERALFAEQATQLDVDRVDFEMKKQNSIFSSLSIVSKEALRNATACASASLPFSPTSRSKTSSITSFNYATPKRNPLKEEASQNFQEKENHEDTLPLIIPPTPATEKLLQKIGNLDHSNCLSPINQTIHKGNI